MSPASVIAIDGPAGSGKSTLGLELARRLGYLYFDTGVLYRALTWLALQRRSDLNDGEALASLARDLDLDVRPPTVDDGRLYTVTAGQLDITWAIREPHVDANVSLVAAQPAVRAALLPAQRGIAARGKVVIVGRDIGTVVAPNAALKVYLEASLEVRARRRQIDLEARGHRDASIEDVRADLAERDRVDAGREAAPLAVAADAVVVENDRASIPQMVDRLEMLARATSDDC